MNFSKQALFFNFIIHFENFSLKAKFNQKQFNQFKSKIIGKVSTSPLKVVSKPAS